MGSPDRQPAADPVFNYHLLRNALDQYRVAPSMLDQAQYQQVLAKARRGHHLESLVLGSPEAQSLVISDAQVDTALEEVAGRYRDRDEFESDLAANGLDGAGLREALYRELLFDAVMQRIGARAADVNDLDMRLFYEMHSESFAAPEMRSARHILITVNPEFMENTRPVALERARQLADKLQDRPNRFTDMAKRHSECPTAVEGGKLGDIKPGTLYPELEQVLFGLKEGEVSDVVESEIGFHLLLCEKIKPARRVSFSKAAPHIRETLLQRRRRNCQKAFLSGLQQVYDA